MNNIARWSAIFGLSIFTGSLLSAWVFAAPSDKSQPNSACSAWQDDFTKKQLDRSRWTVASGQAPGYIPNTHIGYFLPSHVDSGNGLLAITLTQQGGTVGTNPSGVISYGGMIQTNAKCGYGTYEWRMRMSSATNCASCSGVPISGSVSAGFIYVNNSQTEIDVEFSATYPQTAWLVNWLNTSPQNDPTSAEETATGASLPDLAGTFHDYKFVWSAGKIDYYIDGALVVTHTGNVPSAPAYFMITHWGSDSMNWGGVATPGTPRYFYVSHAAYTPQ